MKEIFIFNKMLTPKIITVVYWLLLLGSVGAGLSAMFSGYQNDYVGGIGIIVGGVIGSRIWCELMIVLFKINENMQKLVNKPDTASEE